jgi:ABC-2 type transport system ATP-binding protein
MLYQNFTAVQNLDFFARLGGKTGYSRDDYRDVLLRVGLSEENHHKRLKGFSKGMRQKCGIAIAILKDSPAILLDEPTSGLDPKAGRDFLSLLDSIRAEGKSILMSTHDIFRAREIADQVAIMDNGRIIMQEKADALAGRDLEEIYMQYMGGRAAAVAA